MSRKTIIRTGKRSDGSSYRYPLRLDGFEYEGPELDVEVIPAIEEEEWEDPALTEEGFVDKKVARIGR